MITPGRTRPAEAEGRNDLTMALAEFVSQVPRFGVPTALREVLEVAVLDSLACGLFGLTTEACALVRDFAVGQGGPPEAQVWGSGNGSRVSMVNAAMSNAAAVHGFDFDDHSRAKIHPGAVIIPAALAAADARGADGPTVLAAIAAGYEVMNRISLAANPNASRTKGWHLTGTTGTFGAAAAAAIIFGLDARQTASAFGIAGTQSSGLWAFTADGAMTKRLHPGIAARNGLSAAMLAEIGFDGGSHVLEAADGGFLSATSDDPRPQELLRDLGKHWRALGACFKPYACCGSNHASIDAALQLKRNHGVDPREIETIRIGVSRVVLLQTGFDYRRTSVLNAQMSIRYNVAVALHDDAALIEQFTENRMADPELEALIERIEVVIDPEMDAIYPERYAGKVEFLMKDGQCFHERVDTSRGMPENPMTREELKAKAGSLLFAAAGEVGREKAEALTDLAHGLFNAESVEPLSDFMSGIAIGTITKPKKYGTPE